jgi:hypothetical protein
MSALTVTHGADFTVLKCKKSDFFDEVLNGCKMPQPRSSTSKNHTHGIRALSRRKVPVNLPAMHHPQQKHSAIRRMLQADSVIPGANPKVSTSAFESFDLAQCPQIMGFFQFHDDLPDSHQNIRH